MERGINDFQVARTGSALADDVLDEGGIDFIFAEDDFAVRERLLEINTFDFGDVHHALDNILVVRRNDLAASGPVDFYGVVAGRVVAGGDHNAAVAVLVADEERK